MLSATAENTHQQALDGKIIELVKLLSDNKSSDDIKEKLPEKKYLNQMLKKVDGDGKIYCYLFYIFCAYGRLELVKHMYEQIDDPRLKEKIVGEVHGSTNSTPILVASFYGHVAVVMYLLERGADYKRADNRNNTILHYLARHNIDSLVVINKLKKIIKNKAGDQSKIIWSKLVLRNNDGGINPIHIACRFNSNDLLAQMIDAVYSLNLPEEKNFGRTPLQQACINGNIKIVNGLLNGITESGIDLDINYRNFSNRTALDLVMMLLANKKRKDFSDSDKYIINTCKIKELLVSKHASQLDVNSFNSAYLTEIINLIKDYLNKADKEDKKEFISDCIQKIISRLDNISEIIDRTVAEKDEESKEKINYYNIFFKFDKYGFTIVDYLARVNNALIFDKIVEIYNKIKGYGHNPVSKLRIPFSCPQNSSNVTTPFYESCFFGSEEIANKILTHNWESEKDELKKMIFFERPVDKLSPLMAVIRGIRPELVDNILHVVDYTDLESKGHLKNVIKLAIENFSLVARDSKDSITLKKCNKDF